MYHKSPNDQVCVVATGNAHKLQEITSILQDVLPDVQFVSIKEFGNFDDPEESGSTFFDNALIKAQDALVKTGARMAIADDSGLMVDALDLAPGVLSARFAGTHGDDAVNNKKLLELLEGTPEQNRIARFCSCIVMAFHDGEVVSAQGFCEGVIGMEEKGEHGFGYDPLFLPNATPGKTMAELSFEEKNAISHRYHALKNMAMRLA